MNDRYLYRGKRLDNGKWVTGHLVGLRDNRYAIATFLFSYGNQLGFDDVCEKSIGQCTGLRDKNGNLIFEGDIVSDSKDGSYSEGYVGAVKWGADTNDTYKSCSYRARLWAPGRVNCYERELSHQESQRWTIIGNIHDNPKLLKGGEEE